MNTKKRQKKDYENIIRELKTENLKLKNRINDYDVYILSLENEILDLLDTIHYYRYILRTK